MSHVLLVTEDRLLIASAELQASELEKNGHFVTYSPTSHPLRLLNKNFDTIHLLARSLPLKPKQYIFALAAQALGLSVILSLYEHSPFNRVARLQLRSIDGLTAFCLSQYNLLKFFNKNKMIFAGLAEEHKSLPVTKKTQERLVVFPILNTMTEMPEKMNMTRTPFIVDASLVPASQRKIIKREWTTWKKQHPQNENALFVTQWETIQQLARDQSLVMVTSHLNLDAVQTLAFYNRCIQQKAVWIPNQDQASAFSHLWNQLESRLVIDSDYTFIDGFYQGLSEFNFTAATMNEVKTNELTRLYSRVQNEKSSFANRLSDNIEV